MSLGSYLHANGYKIGSEYLTDITDAYDGDTLFIDPDGVDINGREKAKFRYTKKGAGARYSWRSAKGVYDAGVITGTIRVIPPGGTDDDATECRFSIALDRTRPSRYDTPYIHACVKLPGGAPDEGSFTGQGN